jgi:hypothetical protein
MVGPFWVVEHRGRAVLIAHAVPLAQAVPYGDMLTVEMGHFEFWSELAQRGTRTLSAAGLPTAPVWSEYEEWPRGRVLYDCLARAFVMRADRQLLGTAFRRLIAAGFDIPLVGTKILSDEHYRSVRRLPVPTIDDTSTTQ